VYEARERKELEGMGMLEGPQVENKWTKA